MPEQINNLKTFSLSEVTRSIQKALEEKNTGTFWVRAEMNKLNYYNRSGHCFPELVEKRGEVVVAQMRGVIWKMDFITINNNFRRVLREPLKDGIKILFLARVNFDPVHGLSLGILDIDPSFTLGDLEKEKQESLERLKLEGVFSRNKELAIPLLPQRIAIISVETSKGFADFRKVIDGNAWGYHFFYHLFPSILQGEKAVTGIIQQLNRIRKVLYHFDVVAIIRGGGGDIGLSCYNNYSLAREIALFPLPVITGIGHATNETVAEMISHSNAITPTKLAELLIQKFHDFAFPLRDAEKTIIDKSRRLLSEEHARFSHLARLFKSATRNVLQTNKTEMKSMSVTISSEARFRFQSEKHALATLSTGLQKDVTAHLGQSRSEMTSCMISISKGSQYTTQNARQQLEQLRLIMPARTLELLIRSNTEVSAIEKNVFNLSPQNVLKRGYSITLLNGKAIKSINEAGNGDVITTRLSDGQLTSTVEKIKKEKDQ